MVTSAVLRQQQVMQWFVSSPVWEGWIESLYCRSHVSDLTIVAAKAWPKCFLIKIKGASIAWGSPSHTAEQHSYCGLHLVLVLVWSCSVLSSAMHSLVYHSLTRLSISQQTASPNQQDAAAEHPRRWKRGPCLTSVTGFSSLLYMF